MPELPEVDVVRAGLTPALTGATVQAIEVFDRRSLKRHRPELGEFEKILPGVTFMAPIRRGKFMWVPFADNLALLAHLGMSGQMLLRSPDATDDKHVRVRIWLEHPKVGELRLDFSDQRIFGSLAIDELVETGDGFAAGLGSDSSLIPIQAAHISRDALDPHFDTAMFKRRLKRRNSEIKRSLLDQGLISGIGNIYADEALWASRVHPQMPSAELSNSKVDELLINVKQVFSKALAVGGTSFDAQYVNVNGQSGYFAHSLNAYGQTGKPCARCGTPIARAPFMNRSSHFCPKCQRLGRSKVI